MAEEHTPVTTRSLSEADMNAALGGVHRDGPVRARVIGGDTFAGMGDLHLVSQRYGADDLALSGARVANISEVSTGGRRAYQNTLGA